MKLVRLAEVLLPLVTARAWSPWVPGLKGSPELALLRRRVSAARLGDGRHPGRSQHRLFDDVQ